MADLPMCPLGSVLFPYLQLPLQLRVFEERYLVMLSRILVNEPAEFGVVLIERGQEVGGGEQRFPLARSRRSPSSPTRPGRTTESRGLPVAPVVSRAGEPCGD